MQIHLKPFFSFVVIFLIILTFFSKEASAANRFCDFDEYLEHLPRLSKINPTQRIDRIVISKKQRKLYLFSKNLLYKSYNVAFGMFYNLGPKQFDGDYKTPEGLYYIDFKKQNSNYYKALHVSYPNESDIKHARSYGQSAGGDIMIHGFPKNGLKEFVGVNIAALHPNTDWTRGCIAVTNSEMDEIFNLVSAPDVARKFQKKQNTLTPVEICPN